MIVNAIRLTCAVALGWVTAWLLWNCSQGLVNWSLSPVPAMVLIPILGLMAAALSAKATVVLVPAPIRRAVKARVWRG